MRIDISSDGKWIRAEARGTADTYNAETTVTTIVMSAETGDVCEDQKV